MKIGHQAIDAPCADYKFQRVIPFSEKLEAKHRKMWFTSMG